ncbi:hypothetical protein N431DRAFT_474175 [Stipitochalara longipes BDJ]|nr:hypothetical protein N431DRAFT_474175 [Stipitochalara longipes BDJ]
MEIPEDVASLDAPQVMVPVEICSLAFSPRIASNIIVPVEISTLVTPPKEASEAIVPVQLNTLASELLLRIFDSLEEGEATCLGLTCRRFYNMLKAQYPEPINLRIRMTLQNPCHDCTNGRLTISWWGCCWTALSHLLASWVGPCYRLGCDSSPKFLFYNRKTYGERDGPVPTPQELRAMNRYSDYNYISQRAYRDECNFASRSVEAPFPPLPYPFNKGDDWYPEAITAIKEDVSHFDSLQKWKYFWSPLFIFRENRELFDNFEDEYLWELWSEGLALMRF